MQHDDEQPTIPDADRIVAQLYEAAAGLVPWPAALSALSRAFDAMVVQYVTFDVTTGRLIGCEQPEAMAVDAVLDYMREYNRIDPHTEYLQRLPLGTTMDTEVEFAGRRMDLHPFYRDFWFPYGVRGMLAGKVDEGENHYSCIGIVRAIDKPRFTGEQLALARRLVHHLSVAFRVARHAERLQTMSRVGLHLMDQADRPMLLVGRDRRVRFANAAARAYLADGDVLVERGGVLALRVPRHQRSLRDALDALAQRASDAASATPVDAGTRPRTTSVRAALRLSGASGRTALCTLWHLDAAGGGALFGDRTAVLMSIAHPLLGTPPDPHFVAAMLDLTPAEARLASMLVLGQELVDIAGAQGVSINTVRTQLRAIYAKTGTRRQAELIRLISRACAP